MGRIVTQKTTLERAFELACSGNYITIKEIGYRLHSEGYDISQLEGESLRKQLKALIAKARN